MYEAEKGNISIAVTGDAMISRRMRPFREPDFLGLIDLLRGSDMTLAKLELTGRQNGTGIARLEPRRTDASRSRWPHYRTLMTGGKPICGGAMGAWPSCRRRGNQN